MGNELFILAYTIMGTCILVALGFSLSAVRVIYHSRRPSPVVRTGLPLHIPTWTEIENQRRRMRPPSFQVADPGSYRLHDFATTDPEFLPSTSLDLPPYPTPDSCPPPEYEPRALAQTEEELEQSSQDITELVGGEAVEERGE